MSSIRIAIRSGVAAAVAFCSGATLAAQAAPGSPPPVGRLVDVGGHKLHLNCTGRGSPTTMIVGAGYSFDWDLVQGPASRRGRVCSYDPAGSAWSDNSPTPRTCDAHITELLRLLDVAGIRDPLVLVGQSIGGVFARLYAARYPEHVAGMVIVDHAAVVRMRGPPVGTRGAAVPPASIVVGSGGKLPPGVVLAPGVKLPPGTVLPPPNGGAGNGESPYAALPPRDRALHQWADSRPSSESPREQRAMFDQCIAEADSIGARHERLLGNKPLVVIHLRMSDPGYAALQQRLLRMSSNSARIVADSSGHLIQIDRPDLVVHAIDMVRVALRSHGRVVSRPRARRIEPDEPPGIDRPVANRVQREP